MKLLKTLLLAAVLVQCYACNEKQTYDATQFDVIIQNVKLFDGEQVFDNSTILTKDGVIKEIITDKLTTYIGDNVVDGKGKTLIPGLINAHVHAFNKQHSQSAVQSGVLTLLDMFSNYKVMRDSLTLLGNTSKDYAYFYSAQATVTVPDGHCTQFGPVPTITSAEEIPQFVEDRIAEGSDYIKIIIEGGSVSNPLPTLSDEMVKLAVEKSNALNKISLAHISWRADAIMAADYGINGIAHIWRRDSIGISNKELEILKQKKTFIIPTLMVRKTSADKYEGYADMDLVMNDNLKLYQAGIPLLAGTDAPNNGLNYGSDLIKEMELLVTSGLSSLDALIAATSNPSIQFKLGDKGFVKTGASADFVLIKGNPTHDIKALNNIIGIWKFGEQIVLDK